jgi:hypothetical protein
MVYSIFATNDFLRRMAQISTNSSLGANGVWMDVADYPVRNKDLGILQFNPFSLLSELLTAIRFSFFVSPVGGSSSSNEPHKKQLQFRFRRVAIMTAASLPMQVTTIQ